MKFSIIIPTYNGEKYIEETIKSIALQTYKNYEIIVVDDFSVDETVNKLKNIDFVELNIIVKPENKGLSNSINLAVSKARGEIIICLGQDDLLAPEHLEKLFLVYSKDTSITITHNASKTINKDGEIVGVFINEGRLINVTNNYRLEMCKRNIFQSCGLSFRKEAFVKVDGWDERYKIFGEWLIYIKISKLGKLYYVPELYSYYRRHDNNITNTFTSLSSFIERRRYFKHCRYEALNDSYIGNVDKIKIRIFHFFWDVNQLWRASVDKFR